MYKVLKEFHFIYDASGVGPRDRWPVKDSYGVWHIPLSHVYLGENRVPSISMDYNLWMTESRATEEAVKGTPLWNKYYDEVVASYMDYFNSNFNGNRAPVIIANHFNKWNDGVYLEAMKTLAENVCGRTFVRCVTFKELAEYLNTAEVSHLAGK